MRYMTIREASTACGLTVRRLQQMCKEGKFEGLKKEGRNWLIPSGAVIALGSSARLPLPVGISGYIKAVSSYYYVDKTLLIRDLLDAMPSVSLFTRPRRFGKTLNMDMLRVFFEKTEEDTSVYFKNQAIWSCGPKYRKHQGQYPVIYLSFKDVKHGKWDQTLQDIHGILQNEFARHAELAESSALNPVEKAYYQAVINDPADEVELARSLAMLSAMLKKHHGKDTVIIIDEYDTPIQQGYMNGYYAEAVSFIRNLFSGAFKDNPALAFGFMTGILRVAKESIFSGMNNLKVNTILDSRYSGYFGFTKDEVKELLSYYGEEEKLEEVCRWYDGYRFGNQEIFNPWSVINYLDEGCTPKAYWQSTGSNEVIGDIVAGATPEISENLRGLMQGETVTAYADTDVIYPEIHKRPSSVYSFLMVTGYLKCSEAVLQEDGHTLCSLSIPNREIGYVYAREIIDRLGGTDAESTAAAVQTAVARKDAALLRDAIQNYMIQTISVNDGSGEAFYQGLLLGLCAVLNNRYFVRSNRESGWGRFDIQLMPMDLSMPGFIMELKATKDAKESLETLAETALKQIREKEYTAEMRAAGVGEILLIGAAFRGKQLSVKSE